MSGKPALVTRLAIGTMAGLAFGLAGFLSVPYLLPDGGGMLRFGLLLWHATVGALIGIASACEACPVLTRQLPWWLAGPVLGAWMNLVLAFLIHDALTGFGAALFGAASALASPFWVVAEGMAVGLVAGFCASRPGGGGPGEVES